MCKEDDIKCKICSSKLCVSCCCGYAMALFRFVVFSLHFSFFAPSLGDHLLNTRATIFLRHTNEIANERGKDRDQEENGKKSEREREKGRKKDTAVQSQALPVSANAVTFLLLAVHSKRIVGSVWGNMSRYLNYSKSFIMAIITNANFRRFVFFWLASSWLHASGTMFALPYPFFTILSMYLLYDFSSSPSSSSSHPLYTVPFPFFFSYVRAQNARMMLMFPIFFPYLCQTMLHMCLFHHNFSFFVFIFARLSSSFHLLISFFTAFLRCNSFPSPSFSRSLYNFNENI